MSSSAAEPIAPGLAWTPGGRAVRESPSTTPVSEVPWGDGMVVGQSTPFRAAVALATRIGASRAQTVLVCGETGTGKELFARGIHACSVAANEPFVAINCAAIPETLLESELFGHERGAFTDARTLKRGLLEVAGRGSVFLDEIGELPLKLQPKLLRVLEQRTFRRVGGASELPINARIIAGTNVALAEAVDTGTFREDLFYRLSVARVDLPPLRERPGDIDILARHFLIEMARDGDGVPASLSADALDALRGHSWPGNVRELKNVIERAVIVAGGHIIQRQHLLFQRRRSVRPGSDVESGGAVGDFSQPRASDTASGGVIRIPPGGRSLADIESEVIQLTLSLAGGNLSATARILGISRPTLARKLRQAGLTRRSILSAS